MKTILIYIFFFCIFLFIGCKEGLISEEKSKFLSSDNLLGTWIEEGHEENILVLRKAIHLDSSKYGFCIITNGKFLERKNGGWCGTPPVHYVNFEGTWKAESESILDIEVAFWGGITNYKIEIISVTKRELKIIYHY